MKVCPVCNETFGDDLKFCDLDGTRLDRESGSSIRDPNKLWSMLGVGLLLGAVVISAATVLFFPQADITPSLATPGIEPLGNSTASGNTDSTTTDHAQKEAAQPEAIANLIAPSGLKETKSDEPAAEDSTETAADPKAASKEGGETEATEKTDGGTGDAALTPPNPKKPTPTIKTVSDTSASDTAVKTSKPAAGTKDAKAEKKEADSKKKDKKDEKDDKKKKGGFFGVFKKIFGKN